MTDNGIEWVNIPDGTVTLAEGGYLATATSFDVKSFAITRYPITNAQYGRFIETGGYADPQWWSEIGWTARQRFNWQEAHYWQDRTWNRPQHPVVGVSWHEAAAFCRWLGAEIQQDVTLPTEQQWQRAAQGNDGREYPWGNDEPTAERCNWNRDWDETTPVDAFPDGASPFGVMDMSGNVWEWCQTGWDSGESDGSEPRILRGGSWSNDSPLSLRAIHRSPGDPNTRQHPAYRTHVTVGFRCARQ